MQSLQKSGAACGLFFLLKEWCLQHKSGAAGGFFFFLVVIQPVQNWCGRVTRTKDLFLWPYVYRTENRHKLPNPGLLIDCDDEYCIIKKFMVLFQLKHTVMKEKSLKSNRERNNEC